MEKNRVVVFKLYPFEIGQKIYIDSGRRAGDWQVAAVNETKVTLRCPVTHKEFEWARFCYFVEERDDLDWPSKD
jgi:Fe-S cluster biosynthesis and repair protein YggX